MSRRDPLKQSGTLMLKPLPTPHWRRQRGAHRLGRAACLLSLSLLYGCAPAGWDDTTTIVCTGGEKPAIFSYSVVAQGVKFPGMPIMHQRDIPTWVQYLWVEKDRFLVIYSGRKLHCDNFDAMRRNPLTTGCQGHRVVQGHTMLKYSDGRMHSWDPPGGRQFLASNLDFEPVEMPDITIEECEQVSGYIYTQFYDMLWYLGLAG